MTRAGYAARAGSWPQGVGENQWGTGQPTSRTAGPAGLTMMLFVTRNMDPSGPMSGSPKPAWWWWWWCASPISLRASEGAARVGVRPRPEQTGKPGTSHGLAIKIQGRAFQYVVILNPLGQHRVKREEGRSLNERSEGCCSISRKNWASPRRISTNQFHRAIARRSSYHTSLFDCAATSICERARRWKSGGSSHLLDSPCAPSRRVTRASTGDRCARISTGPPAPLMWSAAVGGSAR